MIIPISFERNGINENYFLAVTLLCLVRGDFSANDLSTFINVAVTSALDCINGQSETFTIYSSYR